MDRSRIDRNRKLRCGNYNSVAESDYDVVDDQEEVLNVRILPARPIHAEQEYADRGLPRSSSAQSLSSLSSGNSNIHLREIPRPSAPDLSRRMRPAINRDLKPGRRKTRFERRPAPPVRRPADQHSRRPSPSSPPPSPPPSPPFTSELVSHLPELTLHEPRGGDGRRPIRKGEVSPHSQGLQRADSVHHNNQRHSLDLETHEIDWRAQRSLERVPSKRHHHEWPQTKEDIDQHEFVPMEKPQQTSCEEDWYVGTCNRAEAEHALHLVNKDGAFLVRDCSVNTNSEPLVLSVYHEKKVYNVKIRFIESTGKFALGTSQRSNDMFNTVAEIIKFHSLFPIILISGRNVPGSRYPENCVVLTCPVTKRDVDQLLQ
ncbi:uncharacterized protein [Pagrus major]|uniref:uncharacterized protein n=1 Tax=Pagrus major TaxID=143350 RepID=UPI003CC83ECD